MRIYPEQTLALVVDVQERLLPHISEHEKLLNDMIKLIKGLKLLDIPFLLNEQYPKGIGTTVQPIKMLLDSSEPFEKVTFSCCKNDTTMDSIIQKKKKFIIVFGIETHVCVMQTVIDLLEAGYIPVLVTDCVGSRKEADKIIALQRMMQAGAIPVTLESLLFELCVSAKNSAFKEISKLVK